MIPKKTKKEKKKTRVCTLEWVIAEFQRKMTEVSREKSCCRKKMVKQLTGKLDDSPLHSAARSGNMGLAMEIMVTSEAEDLRELLSKQNQAGETAFYVASEYGYVDLVKEMLTYYDITCASIKARNGYDAFHIAAKKGDLGKKAYHY